MDTKHTPEPWRLAECDPSCVYTDGGDLLADCYRHGLAPKEEENANAARIVACVNACAGIEDPAVALAEVRAAWDEMRHLLVHIPTYCGHEDCRACPRNRADIERVRRAIAALGGAS